MARWLILLGALCASAGALAADAERGKQLHDKNCVACHNSLMGGNHEKMYTRSDRRVGSLEGLAKQVRMCERNLGLTWFDEDIADVVAYLNQRYYHF